MRVTLQGEVTGGQVAAGEAEQRVRRAIARFDRDLADVEISLSDASRPGSPGARTCAIKATPHEGRPILVTETAGEMERAVTTASIELVRRLSEAGYGGGREAAGEAAP